MEEYDMNEIVGSANILFVVLDALRYDVAQEEFDAGRLQNFQKFLPPKGWEKCHSPGSFTYPAHKAFFAGFLPTPLLGAKSRLFAAKFQGSMSTTSNTYAFEEHDFISALRNIGYRTCCIGGVGFFNKTTNISKEFPSLFEESHWTSDLGVTSKNSTELQFNLASKWLKKTCERFCLFINVSAIHQPNYFYCRQENKDDLESHAAALRYVDKQLPILMDAIDNKGDTFCIFCSDHGTAYGENGFWGHRNAHSSVMEVPYTHFLNKGLH
ncbi:MAG: STM4013/SEN3800 family hydrolase [Flavobacteriales bacterium]|nr:STM4013/SEN3800 family hydrolase [Flavobacteriales bacterium]